MRKLFLSVLVVTLLAFDASAMFMLQDTEKVPIARLFTNLQQRLVKNTNDYQLHYQLARLHAMAFSTNAGEMPASKRDGSVVFGYYGSDAGVPDVLQTPTNAVARTNGLAHLTNAIAHYEHAIALMKKSTNVDEVRWLILPTQLGYSWCLQQAGRRDDALRGYRKMLDISWRMEVVGDFVFDEWVKDVWADVKSLKNPIHGRGRGSLGPGVCFSEETIGYLLKLLDPVKDAAEISGLKDKQTKLSSMGRSVTPILIPLDNSPFEKLVDARATVAFDLDGSGLQRQWGWITPHAAWLVYDATATGKITSGLQMFGSVTFLIFWRDGYQALGALDDNNDGVLRGNELRGLALWRDVNGNGISDPGEVRPVGDYGIQSLDCGSEWVGPDLRRSANGVRFEDGSIRPSYDWLVPVTGIGRVE